VQVESTVQIQGVLVRCTYSITASRVLLNAVVGRMHPLTSKTPHLKMIGYKARMHIVVVQLYAVRL